jgi:gliding motility-associated protein GldL
MNDAGKNMAEQFAQSSQGFVDNYKSLEEKIQENIELIATGNQSYNEKLELLNKNLSALNSVYELQMQNTNEHVESSKTVFNEMDVLMNNLKESVDETKAYKEEISKLNSNLTALNAIYGNMLSAMNVVK